MLTLAHLTVVGFHPAEDAETKRISGNLDLQPTDAESQRCLGRGVMLHLTADQVDQLEVSDAGVGGQFELVFVPTVKDAPVQATVAETKAPAGASGKAA